MKTITILLLLSMLTGCGWFDRKIAAISGDGSETCHSGVVYLQFTSGVSVKYLPDGKIATCK